MAVEEKADETQDEEEEESCPLFMDGLPRDFSTNVHLAALASLMDDAVDEDEDEDEPKRKPKSVPANDSTQAVTTKKGGGKVDRRSHVRNRRQGVPYSKPATTKTPAASLGEAQLFLKMWSLK